MPIYGHRARVGYLSGPLYAEAYPYEFYKMAPEGVSLIISTLRFNQGTKEEIDQCIALGYDIAREMTATGAQCIIQGVVPINLYYGPQGVQDFIERAERECGIPASTSVTAQVHALQAAGSKKLAVLGLGGERITNLDEYVTSFGFDIVGYGFCNYRYVDLGRISPEETCQKALELARSVPDADTIFVPAPHMPFVVGIERLEQETGKIVISAGQAILWEALRLCKVNDRVDGFGKLLRECVDHVH
ncbi:MAG: hypothetical protein AAB289_15185 [Chloroflexota bacterium]